MKHLYEEEIVGDQTYAQELLSAQSWYNDELKRLNDQLAKKRSEALIKYQQRTVAAAKSQQPQQPQQPQQQKQTGTVTTDGQPVNAQGNPPAQVESHKNIVSVKAINEVDDISYNFTIKKLDESSYDTLDADVEELEDLKDYMDAENISYVEDENGTIIDFDESDLDKEWQEHLDAMGLEKRQSYTENTDDILSYEDEDIEDDDDFFDTSQDIDENKVFYVKVEDDNNEFVGKIYKLFDADSSDWRSKLLIGISDTFEKFNFTPDWDEIDIIAFLRENYSDAELLSEDEYNKYVEKHENKKIKESFHVIPTLKEWLKSL